MNTIDIDKTDMESGFTEQEGSSEIIMYLYRHQDKGFREFQIKLIPSVDPLCIIGVRTPVLRYYATQLSGTMNGDLFLKNLPHKYFEENQLHSFIISEIGFYEECMRETDRFLPFIDNWATCDQLSPKVFRKNRPELMKKIQKWIVSDHPYTLRFGIKMLMDHFLDDMFDPSLPEIVAGIRSENYYVNMMIAWYFSTALAKQYDHVLPFFEKKRLDRWIHLKSIQKAVESFRISPEQKLYLKTLR